MPDYRDLRSLGELIAEAKKYRRLTGKPLGITGEVGDYEAARILELKLEAARTAG